MVFTYSEEFDESRVFPVSQKTKGICFMHKLFLKNILNLLPNILDFLSSDCIFYKLVIINSPKMSSYSCKLFSLEAQVAYESQIPNGKKIFEREKMWTCV